jgi:hypothetical protein
MRDMCCKLRVHTLAVALIVRLYQLLRPPDTHPIPTLMPLSQAKISSDQVDSIASSMQHVGEMTIRKLHFMLKALNKFDYLQTDTAKQLAATCFDAYINRPLLGNTPVRKTINMTHEEAIAGLVTITQQVNEVVCTTLLKGDSLAHIYRMLNQHQKVNITSRSLVVLNLYFEDKLLGKYDLRDLLIKSIQQWCSLPPALIQEVYFQGFVNRLAKPMYDTLKLLVLNKNRQRSYIEAVMLPDWLALQAEAQAVDAKFSKQESVQPYLSYYVLFVLLDILDRHLSSAMSIRLFYSHEDVSFAYWYRHYLLSAQLNQFTLMKQSKQAATIQQPENKVRGKKKNNKKASEDSAEIKTTPQEDDLYMSVLAIKRMLCSGLLRFIAALRQVNLLDSKVYEFTSLRKVFEKRFEVYQTVRQPPPLTFDDYLQGSDFSRVSPNDLYKSTLDLFQNCKASVEKLLEGLTGVDQLYAPITEKEARALLKVCVGNTVYLHRLQQIVKGKDAVRVTVVFDNDTHDEFCTIKLL